jgi:hypothetical protein
MPVLAEKRQAIVEAFPTETDGRALLLTAATLYTFITTDSIGMKAKCGLPPRQYCTGLIALEAPYRNILVDYDYAGA